MVDITRFGLKKFINLQAGMKIGKRTIVSINPNGVIIVKSGKTNSFNISAEDIVKEMDDTTFINLPYQYITANEVARHIGGNNLLGSLEIVNGQYVVKTIPLDAESALLINQDCFPVLSSVINITEEDAKAVASMVTKISFADALFIRFDDSIKLSLDEYTVLIYPTKIVAMKNKIIIPIENMFSVTSALLSRGYDLYDLIGKGKAFDKNKVTAD